MIPENLKIKKYSVDLNLKRFVNRIWTIENTSSTTNEEYYLLSNGCYNIAVIYGESAQMHTRNSDLNFGNGIFLSTQLQTVTKIVMAPKMKFLLIQLHIYVPSMFGLYDKLQQLNTLIKFDVRKHYFYKDPLLKNEAYFINFITHYLKRSKIQNLRKTLVEKVYDYVLERDCDVLVYEVANYLNISVSYVQRIFKLHTGITLKAFIKVIKFRRTVAEIVSFSDEKGILTHSSIDNGYFDQSHLYKAFKEFIEIKPSELKNKNIILPELINES